MLDKKQGSQVLRELQTMVHGRSDERVDELLDELCEYLAKHGRAVEREDKRGRNRMSRGGRDRAE